MQTNDMDNISTDFIVKLVQHKITKEELEAEMVWSRSIDFNNEQDVKRAAAEIRLAIAEAKKSASEVS